MFYNSKRAPIILPSAEVTKDTKMALTHFIVHQNYSMIVAQPRLFLLNGATKILITIEDVQVQLLQGM